MFSAREFDELGRDIDVVRRVVDRLSAAAAYVILVPAIAVKLVLLTCMPECYTNQRLVCNTCDTSIGMQAMEMRVLLTLTVLHARIVFNPRP